MRTSSSRDWPALGSSHTIRAMSQPASIDFSAMCQNGSCMASRAMPDSASLDLGVEQLRHGDHPGEEEGADDVGGEHHGPQPQHPARADGRALGQHRQHGGQRALGEELLAAQHHDHEAGGVAEAGDQDAPGRVRQGAADHRHHQEREAHRQAGAEARPGQRRDGAASSRSPSWRMMSWIITGSGAEEIAAWNVSLSFSCSGGSPSGGSGSWVMAWGTLRRSEAAGYRCRRPRATKKGPPRGGPPRSSIARADQSFWM